MEKEYCGSVTGGAVVWFDLKEEWRDLYSVSELDAPCFVSTGSMRNLNGSTVGYAPIVDRMAW